MFVYLEFLKNRDVRFQVLTYDKETKTGKLKGEYGAEFTRDLSKEALAKFGYELVKSAVELPLMSSPPLAKTKPPVAATQEEE